MSSQELRELHEHAEHGRHEPTMAPVSFSMALLAVIVAAVSLLGHRTHTEEVLLQNEISDKWAHYQAKTIRRNTDQVFVDLAMMMGSSSPSAITLQQKYKGEIERYRHDQGDLDKEARQLETQKLLAQKRANAYDLGEVLLEIALVVTSITLLSKLRWFWYAGAVVGLAGLVITIIAIFFR
jgi:hypothetical protein